MAMLLVVPAAVRFLMAYQSEGLRPLLSVDSYLGFVTFLALSFGLVFQLPLVMFFLTWAGLVTPFELASKRRILYLGAFVAAALLTPGPDVLSQLLLAVPIVFLYEVSLMLISWSASLRSTSDMRHRGTEHLGA